jgi:hypothetical protein
LQDQTALWVLQECEDRRAALRSIRGFLGQAGGDRLFPRRWNRRDVHDPELLAAASHGDRLFLHELGEDIAAEERRLAGKEFVHCGTERVDIIEVRGTLTHRLLRAHVGRSTRVIRTDGDAAERIAQARGDAEISNLQPTIGRHHEIARLQVAMGDACLFVSVIKGGAELLKPGQHFVTIEASAGALSFLLSETQPLDVLHDDRCGRGVLLKAEDPNDAGVSKFHPAQDLLLQIGDAFRIADNRLRDELQGDLQVEDGILCQDDDAHSATAQLANGPVSAEEQRLLGRGLRLRFQGFRGGERLDAFVNGLGRVWHGWDEFGSGGWAVNWIEKSKSEAVPDVR